ncbi:hypothetical protein [Brevundimonas sp.]|uniref:hypothetical protein n=1 Tax=Brevundimonas sp. TaxID=1871086 RepID=UPI0026157022|nr:hypothetical protein [Brevundimonas sp.]
MTRGRRPVGFIGLVTAWISALALWAAAGAATAQSTTYTIESPTYASVAAAPACTLSECFNYTTAMKVQGTITFAAPLAPNLTLSDVGLQVTGFNLNDGVRTYTPGPNINLHTAAVTTNGAGTVTAFRFIVQKLTGPPFQAGVTDDPNSYISYVAVLQNSAVGYNNRLCLTRSDGPSAAALTGANGSCSASQTDNQTSLGSVSGPVTFQVAAPTPVPTLSEWAFLALCLILATVGGLMAVSRRPA